MADLLKCLLLPVLLAAGWVLGGRWPKAGALLNQGAALALLACWLVEAISGVFGGPEAFHRLLAHGVVGLAWILAPPAVGIFLQEGVARGEGRGILGAFAAGGTMIAVLATAVTGYLGPTRAPSGQNALRFEILHLVAAPGLAAAAMILWAWVARPKAGGTPGRTRSTSRHPARARP
jgi:hypothetical protein